MFGFQGNVGSEFQPWSDCGRELWCVVDELR